jgi:hypothetical protein
MENKKYPNEVVMGLLVTCWSSVREVGDQSLPRGKFRYLSCILSFYAAFHLDFE